ncbi:hypothetical protein [Rhodoligotrophos ferricapiens]|uniref:hypothetical protein n=1 Tax=Rhodoligotrophos ferricapiens TaxID=3069264 RepID=UPI00315DA86B
MRMLSELDATTSHVGELEKLIEQATANDPNDKRYEAMMRAVSLPTRANIIKTLALAAKTLSETAAPQGKKQERQLAAERVASGKFGVPSAPKLVVDNKR